MITFDGWSVPKDFKSDGCTFKIFAWWAVPINVLLFILKIIVYRKDYKPACIMHDFHRLYLTHGENHMTTEAADSIFYYHLIELGMSKPMAKAWRWMVIRMRPWRQETRVLPEKWLQYAVRK